VSECVGFSVPLDVTVRIIGHFGDESFQTVALVLTTKTIKHNTTYALKIKEKQKKTALANKTSYTLIWYGFYYLRSINGVGHILTAQKAEDIHRWLPIEFSLVYQ